MNSLFLLWPFALIPFVILVSFVLFLTVRKRSKTRQLFESGNAKRNYYITLDVVHLKSTKARKLLNDMNAKFSLMKNFSCALLIGLIIISAILVARPSKVVRADEKSSQREIVLCLDVSGSVLPYDKQIISGYKTIVSSFAGERVALVLFDSTSRTVFPLTNDYAMVNNKLDDALAALAPINSAIDVEMLQPSQKEKVTSFLKGTSSKADSASLIGDGLASCALQFNENNTSNPKYIVLATDNIVSGNQVFSLEEGISLASSRGAKIYGIYSGQVSNEGGQSENEMKKLIQNSSGVYYLARSATAISGIVSEISKSQLSNVETVQSPLTIDAPTIPILFLFVIFGMYVVIIWRMRQ